MYLFLRSTVTGINQKHDGGAIMVQTYSNATVDACQFTANQASSNGGAIYIKRRSLTVINNTFFQSNHAKNNGGSIFVQHSKSKITFCTFELESAISGQGEGGSICIENVGNVTILESSFLNCKAFIGGSVAVKTESILRMQYSSVYQSYAKKAGGGLHVTHKSLLVGTNLTISRSKSKLGAGITISGSSRFNLKMLYLFLNNASKSGGSISCEQSQIVLEKGRIYDNYANDHGGALFAKQCHLTVDNIAFSANNALKNGGALYSKSSVTSIHNSEGRKNTAGKKGGFILITETSNLTSNHLTLEQNLADVTGNNIAVVNNSVAEMKHTRILMFYKRQHCSIAVTHGSVMQMTFIYSTRTGNNETGKFGTDEVCVDSSSKSSGTPVGLYCFSTFPVKICIYFPSVILIFL